LSRHSSYLNNDAQIEKKNQEREIAGKMDSINILCELDAFDRGTF
jgi:hypothetical protein